MIHPDCTMPNCDCVGICQHAGKVRPVGALIAALWNEKSCPYCDEHMDVEVAGREPTWDHIVPRARGGTNAAANILAACRDCNLEKADLLLDEWIVRLVRRSDPRAIFVHRVLNLTRHNLVTPTKGTAHGAQNANGRLGNGAADT